MRHFISTAEWLKSRKRARGRKPNENKTDKPINDAIRTIEGSSAKPAAAITVLNAGYMVGRKARGKIKFKWRRMGTKRLTKRDEYGNADIIGVDSADLRGNLNSKEFNRVTYALNKLAAYEEAENDGRTIKLPCQIGNTVYHLIAKTYKKITELQVEEFIFGERGLHFRTRKAHLAHSCDEFGKTIFLTREEAEKALQERRKDSE